MFVNRKKFWSKRGGHVSYTLLCLCGFCVILWIYNFLFLFVGHCRGQGISKAKRGRCWFRLITIKVLYLTKSLKVCSILPVGWWTRKPSFHPDQSLSRVAIPQLVRFLHPKPTPGLCLEKHNVICFLFLSSCQFEQLEMQPESEHHACFTDGTRLKVVLKLENHEYCSQNAFVTFLDLTPWKVLCYTLLIVL